MAAKGRVPLSKDNLKTWVTVFLVVFEPLWGDLIGFVLVIWLCMGEFWLVRPLILTFSLVFGGNFYGMKSLWVGAFTDFGGSRYRNPVHFLGTFRDFPLFSEFSGLVYYTGHFPGGGARFGFRIIKSGCLEAGKLTLKFD